MITRSFALLTISVWLGAAWFARGYLRADPRRGQFWLFFVATMTGNVGVVFAPDVIRFYGFYSLMTFAAYGLVVHERTPSAHRAARVYIVMSVLGEVLLLAAMVLIVGTRVNLPLSEVPAAVARSPHPGALVALLLAGFGVKAGAVPLHVWLPLAHPVAPTPGSAVLSGAMIEAGLLGWLRFLPLGALAMPLHGSTCVLVGFVAAICAALIGATQRDAKTALAYSSVSQMGLATVAIGVALSVPESALAASKALALFAVHHAFAKSALFLGVAIVAAERRPSARRRMAMAGMVLAALAIAGAPFTAGAAAKLSLHDVVGASPSSAAFEWVLSIAAVGSALVMLRVLALTSAQEQRSSHVGARTPWIYLLVAPWPLLVAPAARELLQPAHVWSAVGPIAIGIAVTVALRRRPPHVVRAGDLLHVIVVSSRALLSLAAWLAPAVQRGLARLRIVRATVATRGGHLLGWTDRAEEHLATFGAIGALALLVIAALLLSLIAR